MYIYNVTANIDASVHDEWLVWMKETHIPNVLATGKFLSARMCKVITEEDMGGVTYAVQYTTIDKETLQSYYDDFATTMQAEVVSMFSNKFVSFRTELEVISEH